MTFGEKLKTARKTKKLTQEQLGEKIGVKGNTVSDWEHDKSRPDMDTVELLCGILDLAPSFIMGSKSEEEYGVLFGKIAADIELIDLIEKYQSLSIEDKKAVRQIISSLSKVGRE